MAQDKEETRFLNVNLLFDVSSKVVVVSGGGRGIGEMIATAFAANGVKKIYITSRSRKTLEGTAAKLNAIKKDVCEIIEADLSTVEGCRKVGDDIQKREQRVDILINNSGATWGEPLEKFSEKGWDRVMDLNVKGLFFLTQSLLPLLKAAASKEDPSRIINIGSINGLNIPTYDTFSYTASKAAVHHLTRDLAFKLSKHNITVNAIAAGPFPTKMMSFIEESAVASLVPLGRVGNTPDIGGTCLFLCSKAGAWVTGTVIPVDGGVLVKASL